MALAVLIVSAVQSVVPLLPWFQMKYFLKKTRGFSRCKRSERVRNKFLGTGEHGYHPFRKIKVCISGLHYAIRFDFSVAYKFYLALLMLVALFSPAMG